MSPTRARIMDLKINIKYVFQRKLSEVLEPLTHVWLITSL